MAFALLQWKFDPIMRQIKPPLISFESSPTLNPEAPFCLRRNRALCIDVTTYFYGFVLTI
jgi:hypothetical protein